jgi:hypothetical protein
MPVVRYTSMTRISPAAKTDTGKDAKKNTKELKPAPEEKKEVPPTTDKKENSKKKAKK